MSDQPQAQLPPFKKQVWQYLTVGFQRAVSAPSQVIEQHYSIWTGRFYLWPSWSTENSKDWRMFDKDSGLPFNCGPVSVFKFYFLSFGFASVKLIAGEEGEL